MRVRLLCKSVPLNSVLFMTPKQYFTAANALMASNSSPDADADALARFAALNIGPGLTHLQRRAFIDRIARGGAAKEKAVSIAGGAVSGHVP